MSAPHPIEIRSSASSSAPLWLIVALAGVTALGPLTVDFLLPALPAVQGSLVVPERQLSLLVAGATAGLAAGQIVVGPLSDQVGRRWPLMAGAGLHVIASIAAASATTIWVPAGLRFTQGFAAAACGVVALAIIRDLSAGPGLLVSLSRLAVFVGVVTVAAPVVGSWALDLVGWRGIFWALAGYGLVATGAVAACVGESSPRYLRSRGGLARVWRGYRHVFRDRVFLGAVLTGGLSFAGLFAYLTASGSIIQGMGGLGPASYAALISLNSLGVLAGIQTSSITGRRSDPRKLLPVLVLLMPVAAAGMVVADLLSLGLPVVLVLLWFFVFGHGGAFPCIQTVGLSAHAEEAGTAASLMGACNFLFGSVAALVVGWMDVASPVELGAMLLISSSLALLCSIALIRRTRT